MRAILENVKHKNIKGLETLSQKYFREFLIENDREKLEMAVVAKALSLARTFHYSEEEIEKMFESDLEIVVLAKEFFAKALHELGFTYVRISELLQVDLFDIVNKVVIKERDEELPEEIYIDPSALVALGKMCLLDMLEFLAKEHTLRGWLFSRDIRKYAVERTKVNFVIFENKEYDPIYFIGGKPVRVFSNREMEFVERASFLITNDPMLKCLHYCPKERLEKKLNKAVLIYPEAQEKIKQILSSTTIITVGELIALARKKGFDVKVGNETIIVD
ncbi:MAG: hypothetical protein GXN92_01085 [Candidatus Micrarchaeota archaeon]|nr:hypothetical protein [Candidatus Micrarchaeota archaeon]